MKRLIINLVQGEKIELDAKGLVWRFSDPLVPTANVDGSGLLVGSAFSSVTNKTSQMARWLVVKDSNEKIDPNYYHFDPWANYPSIFSGFVTYIQVVEVKQ